MKCGACFGTGKDQSPYDDISNNSECSVCNGVGLVKGICSVCDNTYQVFDTYGEGGRVIYKDCPKCSVSSPEGYCKGKIECIDAIEAALTGLEGIEAFYTGNVIKYMWRWKQKNGVQDLQKAQTYLNWLIDKLREDEKE